MVSMARTPAIILAAVLAATGYVATGQGPPVPRPDRGGVCHVEDFGAIADDGRDDLPAFRAAHNALPARGGVVAVGPGRYDLSGAWVIGRNCRIVGAGAAAFEALAATRLYFPAGSGGLVIGDGSIRAAGTVVEGLHLCGTPGGSGAGVTVRVTHTTLRAVTAERFGGHGFVWDSHTDPTLNCNLSRGYDLRAYRNGGDGFYLKSGSHGTNAGVFVGLDATGNGGVGIRNEYGHRNTFVGPHADANTGGAYRENGSGQWYDAYAEGSTDPTLTVGRDAVGAVLFIGSYGRPRLVYETPAAARLNTVLSGWAWNRVQVGDPSAGRFDFQADSLGVQIGATSSRVKLHETVRVTPGFTEVAPHSTQDKAVPVPGVVRGAAVVAGPEADIGTAFVWSARCEADGAAVIRVANVTEAAATPVTWPWRVTVLSYPSHPYP